MTRDFHFQQDAGKKMVDGKSVYPDLLRLELDKKQAFSLAMNLLRFVEHSSISGSSKTFEFAVFGKLSELSEGEAVANISKATKSPWRSMKTAPQDGTIILIIETPNGEHFNVMPAMYANMGGGDPRLGEKAEGSIGWWGASGSRYTGEGGDCELPVRYKSLACTPICWMPMPEREELSKLRRRLGQLYRVDKSLD